jgi:hypothetical protein
MIADLYKDSEEEDIKRPEGRIERGTYTERPRPRRPFSRTEMIIEHKGHTVKTPFKVKIIRNESPLDSHSKIKRSRRAMNQTMLEDKLSKKEMRVINQDTEDSTRKARSTILESKGDIKSHREGLINRSGSYCKERSNVMSSNSDLVHLSLQHK